MVVGELADLDLQMMGYLTGSVKLNCIHKKIGAFHCHSLTGDNGVSQGLCVLRFCTMVIIEEMRISSCLQ